MKSTENVLLLAYPTSLYLQEYYLTIKDIGDQNLSHFTLPDNSEVYMKGAGFKKIKKQFAFWKILITLK